MASAPRDTDIPVIDISNPTPQTAQEVLDAASTHGFLFVKNDGVTIPPADIDAMFQLSQNFFAQPTEEKAAFSIHSEQAGGRNRGWVSMQGESLDPSGQKHGDPKEAFNISPPRPNLQPIPPTLAASAPLITRFQNACHTLCLNILTLLGTALEIPTAHGGPTYFATRHDPTLPSGTIFRLLYYPQTSAPTTTTTTTTTSTSIRAGAHSDYGSITLLFRLPGQPGLEVLTAQQIWAPVPVNPAPSLYAHPPILVNIGDLLSFWTGGALKSTVHRVVFEGGEERFSMAYFCHPWDEVRLEAVPGKGIGDGKEGNEEGRRQRERLGLGESEEGEEGVLTAKGHLDRRLKVTYGLKD